MAVHCSSISFCNRPLDSLRWFCQSNILKVSGVCLSQLDSPPTTSPTSTGGLDVYYPDYGAAWDKGVCVNTRPMPSGRPTYSTMLACCKGAYAGQTNGYCLSQLDSPPTASPISSDSTADFWYPGERVGSESSAK